MSVIIKHFSVFLTRYLKFKDQYKVVKELRAQSGFGWDDVKCMVTAEPQVWDSYLKVSFLCCMVDH